MTRIDEIRERLDKATPGPWEVDTDGSGGSGIFFDDEHMKPVCLYAKSGDADLIANAPADLAWCLAKLDAIRALHKPFEWSFGEGPVQSCAECARLGASEEEASYPCPTIRALNDTKEN